MKFRPLFHKAAGPMRQITPDYIERLDLEDGLVFRIGGMKVGRIVFPPEHFDRDPEESADGRHSDSVYMYTSFFNPMPGLAA